MRQRWFITYLQGTEAWWAFATQSPTPRNADFKTLMTFPGDVHFSYGDSLIEARDRLEAELPE